ncbi:MAG: hypothetical protein ACI4T9_00960 [Prevotella sp.]|jgi:hypothetical protein
MLTNNNTFEHKPFGNRREEQKPVNDHFRSTRQWLNIIFMVGAVIGVLLYVFHTPQTVGIIVILVSMIFKIIECALRFIK